MPDSVRRALLTTLLAILGPTAAAQITLPPTIDDSTFGPLRSGNVYIAPQTVTVPVGTTQTIEKDVVIKFDQNTELVVRGTLDAQGTLAEPIFMTSLRDDSVGGQTDPLAPAPGDFRGLEIANSSVSSEIRGVVVRYGGGIQSASLEVSSNVAVLIEDCVVELSGSDGMSVSTSSLPTVRRCDFRDNAGRAVTGFSLVALSGFEDNTSSGNGGGDPIFVSRAQTSGSLTLGPQNALGDVLVLEADLQVQTDDTLTLQAGLIVKMAPTSLGVKTEVRVIGTLRTEGTETSEVAFTSVFDDSLGGDSLADGATTGTPGDWRKLIFTGSSVGSDLRFTRLRFSGLDIASIVVQSSSPSLFQVAVEFSAGHGLSSTGTPRVRECRFDDGLGRALDIVSWFALSDYVDNTAQGNAQGDYTLVRGGFLTEGFVRVNVWNTLNTSGVIVTGDRTVTFSDNVAMILGPGLIIKFTDPNDSGFVAASGFLQFDGRGYAPIILTSFKDDVYGGDTNGDGAATVGVPGDWMDLRIENSALPTSVNHTYLRFPGLNQRAGLTCSGRASVDQVRVDQSAGDGMVFNDHGGGLRNLVAFVNLGDGIVINGGPHALLHATSAANFGRGIVKDPELEYSLGACISWFNNNGGSASSNIVGFDDQRIFFCNGSPIHEGVDGNIVADPLFEDPDNGNLRLNLFSPCIGRGGPPNDISTYFDHDGNSRVLDHNLFGFALPDMGAYEYPSYFMEIEGQSRIGKTMTLRVEGQEFQGNPPGLCVLFYGPLGYDGVGLFLPPFGNMLINEQTFPLLLFAFPTQTTISLPIPDDPSLIGLPTNLQALVIALPDDLFGGNWANPFLSTITD